MRWTLSSPTTNESWEMPINPDSMTSPQPAREFKHAYGVRRGGGLDYTRSFLTRPRPIVWEWTGVIRTKEHYDALEYWAKHEGLVHVSDHLGRTFACFITEYDPEDRRPNAHVPWRLRYTMRVQIVRSVA